MLEAPKNHARPKRHSPILTTGQLFLHSCLHFFGLHLPSGSRISTTHMYLLPESRGGGFCASGMTMHVKST